jgi:CHAD domain-containing protein
MMWEFQAFSPIVAGMTKAPPKIQADLPPPVRAETPEIAPGASIAAVFSAFVAAGLHHLEVNAELFAHQPSPQEVHQMRVAVRRMRALIGVFRSALPKALRKRVVRDLKRFQKTLSPARDLDIFLDGVLPILPSLPMQTMLARAARDSHRRAYAKASKVVKGPALATLQTDLAELVLAVSSAPRGEKPARGFARTFLAKKHRKLVRRLDEATRRSDERLHALRIRIKKLRYAVEFFRPAMPKAGAKRFHGALAEAQDVLGAFNDAVSARALARDLMRSSPGFDAGARRAVDMAFAGAEDKARPKAQRKFAALKSELKTAPKHWLR